LLRREARDVAELVGSVTSKRKSTKALASQWHQNEQKQLEKGHWQAIDTGTPTVPLLELTPSFGKIVAAANQCRCSLRGTPRMNTSTRFGRKP
jgi:hypothetical protein